MLLLPKHARRVEFNNARNLLAKITHKWYPELDEESETFLLPASTFSKKTAKDTGKVLVEMYDLEIGLFVQNTATPARMELVEGFDSKVIFMNCDAYTAENVDRLIKKVETSLGSYCH